MAGEHCRDSFVEKLLEDGDTLDCKYSQNIPDTINDRRMNAGFYAANDGKQIYINIWINRALK
jgi:hypothetical protein